MDIIQYLLKGYKNSNKELIHQEILWCLSNLTAGTINHIMHFLTSDFYFITKELLSSNNSVTQLLSLKVFYNLICLDLFDISIKIINNQFILLILKILKDKNSKPENKLKCLSLLNNIFLIGKFTKKSSANTENLNSNGFNELDYELKPDDENNFLNFFLRNEGRDIFNEMQLDINEEIYIKSKLIVEKYFAFEDQ